MTTVAKRSVAYNQAWKLFPCLVHLFRPVFGNYTVINCDSLVEIRFCQTITFGHNGPIFQISCLHTQHYRENLSLHPNHHFSEQAGCVNCCYATHVVTWDVLWTTNGYIFFLTFSVWHNFSAFYASRFDEVHSTKRSTRRVKGKR